MPFEGPAPVPEAVPEAGIAAAAEREAGPALVQLQATRSVSPARPPPWGPAGARVRIRPGLEGFNKTERIGRHKIRRKAGNIRTVFCALG